MQQSYIRTNKEYDRPFKHILSIKWPRCFPSQSHGLTDRMPKTMLQMLGQLAAAGRNYLSTGSSRKQTTASQRSTCRLTARNKRTRKGRRLLVFKVTGPGSKHNKYKNPPCGQADCWICGKLRGKSSLCHFHCVAKSCVFVIADCVFLFQKCSWTI